MGAEEDRLANALGAAAVALYDQMLGDGALAAMPEPTNHPSAAATLALLNWVPKVPQGRLAYCLGLSQPATVRLVDRLQAAGLIRRVRQRGRRQLWIEITDSGRALAERFSAERHGAMKRIVSSLSEGDQALLTRLLDRLAALLLQGREHVMRVCRFCDARACGTDDECPMWRAARVLA